MEDCIYEGNYTEGQKSGRGKLLYKNGDQFIEGEWKNDCLVRLDIAQLQNNNGEYYRIYGMDNLYAGSKHNFVAQIILPTFNIHVAQFHLIRKEIESNIIITNILDDSLKYKLECSRKKFESILTMHRDNVTLYEDVRRDVFELFKLIHAVPKLFDYNKENFFILDKISNNASMTEKLREESKQMYQDEKQFCERNKALVMIQVDMKFSWLEVISEFVNGCIVKIKTVLTGALPSSSFISSEYEDINRLQDHNMFAFNSLDVQLFSDLELTVQQYSNSNIDTHNWKDFIQNYVLQLWTLLISKITHLQNNEISKQTKSVSPVFLQLFKTFLDLVNSICVERKEDISEIIKIKSNADLLLIKSKGNVANPLEIRLKFIISLMNHFKPGDVKKFNYKYNFMFFKVNEAILEKFARSISDYFDNSLSNISQDHVVWLYYTHKCFYTMFCVKDQQDDMNHQELSSFLNSLMNLVKVTITYEDVSLESVRILINSIIKFGETISPHFLQHSAIKENEMSILVKQADFIKAFSTSKRNSVKNITSIVDIYQVFWDERKNIIQELQNKYSTFPSAKELVEKLNSFTEYVYNLKIYNHHFLTFVRSYNEFLRLLQATNFPWYVKQENLEYEKYVKIIDEDNQSYIVDDIKKFINEFLQHQKTVPRHFLLELVINLLNCVENFLENSPWSARNRVQGAGDLLLLMGRSLINFERLRNAVDFQHFFDNFTEPFQRVTQQAGTVHEFKRRLGSLDTYYKYTMELNVMGVIKALDLLEQNVINDSPIDYKFNRLQLHLAYENYELKFKKYIENIILKPDFNVNMFANKIRSKVKLTDKNKWNERYKVLELPKLVSGLCGVWSALESRDVISQQQLIKPHCVQVLCVLLLLGAGDGAAAPGVRSHLAQVLTGQGKSLVLALLAAALALTGNRARVVCYNQLLATRDRDHFQTFYRTFGVEENIIYGTFDDMANDVLNMNIRGTSYNLRTLVHKLVANKLSNLCVTEEEMKISKTVLLIDEVDVFFTPEFYGNIYCPATAINSETFGEIQLKIWNYATNYVSVIEINENIQKYIDEQYHQSTDEIFLDIVRSSRNILNTHITTMISDAIEVRDSSPNNSIFRKYKLNEDNRIIYITNSGEYSSRTYVSYKNVFTYFKLKKSNFEHKNFKNFGYINILCGKVSYAILPKSYQTILGVTGTLKQLSHGEMRAVTSYGISRGSDAPSFFGSNKLRVTGFSIKASVDSWASAVLERVLEIVDEGRAVIVFFKDEHTINTLSDRLATHLSRYVVFTGNEEEEEMARIVAEAGVARNVIIGTRRVGRGVDFQSNDSAVEAKGGVHVIQTFFSEDIKEEIQIKGRTARKDNSGSYEMILCRIHLNEAWYAEDIATYNELNEARVKKTQEREMCLTQKIEISQKKHDDTMKFLDSLRNYEPEKRNEYLETLCNLK